jgi:alkylation response protein AidB-like acyl-CoA dehydrogenase
LEVRSCAAFGERQHRRVAPWPQAGQELSDVVAVRLSVSRCGTGNGISDEYHVIRHVMNLEAVNTYEGTWEPTDAR